MISVEKRKDNEEIVLSFDKSGGEYLINVIKTMIQGDKDTNEHLFTTEWAGTDLSSQKNFEDSTISNMLTLFFLAKQ